jgi:hypothetical protein
MKPLTGVMSVVPDEADFKSKILFFDKIIVLAAGFPDAVDGHLEITPAWDFLESIGIVSHPKIGASPVGPLFVGGDLRPSTYEERRYLDPMARGAASSFGSGHIAICRKPIPDSFIWPGEEPPPVSLETTIRVTLQSFPTPAESCAWEDILNFKQELNDKLWGFRRFVLDLASKTQSEAEVKDDLEWSVNEYRKAMEVHHIKEAQSFVDVFVITPLEILENLLRLEWSKIARGALAVRKRKVELLEAEMKAPGRECAYVFDADKRFGPERSEDGCPQHA